MSTITTVNPATGENIESFEMISAKDAAAKVEACHEAFSEWKLKSLEDRAAVIGGIGKALRDNKEELAQLMTREMGKPLAQARAEAEKCALVCRYYAEHGAAMLAEQFLARLSAAVEKVNCHTWRVNCHAQRVSCRT